MYIVKEETINSAYKPYDIVCNKKSSVGFISEVSINESQDEPSEQVSYAVRWLVGDEKRVAWWSGDELTRHCNLFVEIAKQSCHPLSSNRRWVTKLLGIK